MKFYFAIILFGLTMADHRSKRFLIFPPTSPTRTQLIAGIGVPVDLEHESVLLGWVLKSEYFLPDNTTLLMHFLQEPFNPITLPITRRRRRHVLPDSEIQKSHEPIVKNGTEITGKDHYEKYDVEAIEIDKGVTGNDVDENDSEYTDDDSTEEVHNENTAIDYRLPKPKDFGTTRWALFKAIEIILGSKGLAGRPCMLRTICEAAHAPFSYDSGILAELMHIILTPSSTKDTINEYSHNEYLRAEVVGKSGEPCDKIFPECSHSVLGQFSGIYNKIQNVIKMLG